MTCCTTHVGHAPCAHSTYARMRVHRNEPDLLIITIVPSLARARYIFGESGPMARKLQNCANSVIALDPRPTVTAYSAFVYTCGQACTPTAARTCHVLIIRLHVCGIPLPGIVSTASLVIMRNSCHESYAGPLTDHLDEVPRPSERLAAHTGGSNQVQNVVKPSKFSILCHRSESAQMSKLSVLATVLKNATVANRHLLFLPISC